MEEIKETYKGDMTSKCNMEAWIGPANRIRMSMKICCKSNKVCSLVNSIVQMLISQF